MKAVFLVRISKLETVVQIPILIQRYLAGHKRLVVPQLGAFVVKEPGQVLFTELLKRDDGALRALLAEAGADPLKAAGEIDRFVFEVRHAAEHGAPNSCRSLCRTSGRRKALLYRVLWFWEL